MLNDFFCLHSVFVSRSCVSISQSLWARHRNTCFWFLAFLASYSQADHLSSGHKHLSCAIAGRRPCRCADSSHLQVWHLHSACLRWQQVTVSDVWRVSTFFFVTNLLIIFSCRQWIVSSGFGGIWGSSSPILQGHPEPSGISAISEV